MNDNIESKNIRDFIQSRSHLVWWTEDLDGLSDEMIVEAVLNYGDWTDVQELIGVLGIKKVAEIFKAQTDKKRVNYSEKTKQYFTLYFKEHA